MRRLSESARLILMDPRGSGLSDRFSPDHVPQLEDLIDDITVVLDAVGCDRVVLYGFEEAAAQCAMFAATRPERLLGLILYAPTACGRQSPEYPWQWSDDEWEVYLESVRAGYGTEEFARESLALSDPSHVGDGRIERWWLRKQRLSSSRGSHVVLEQQIRDTDVRALLPAIGVPTLVVHRAGDGSSRRGRGGTSRSRSRGPGSWSCREWITTRGPETVMRSLPRSSRSSSR